MKNLREQPVCSSLVAGLNTARVLLEDREVHEDSDDVEADVRLQTEDERSAMAALIRSLERMQVDPKLSAIRHFLMEERWMELG